MLYVPSFTVLYGLLVLLMCMGTGCARKLPEALSPQENVQLGTAYEYSNDKESAKAQYLKALPTEARAAFHLGNMLFAEGKEDEALRLYRTAVESMPDDPHLNNNIAWVLFTVGQRKADIVQIEEAEQVAQKAVNSAPPELRGYCEDTLEQIRLALRRSRGGEQLVGQPPAKKS